MNDIISSEDSVALYATQGGGLATFKNNVLVWHEIPEDFPEFKVGDPIPDKWDFQPVNQPARDDMFGHDDFDDSERMRLDFIRSPSHRSGFIRSQRLSVDQERFS